MPAILSELIWGGLIFLSAFAWGDLLLTRRYSSNWSRPDKLLLATGLGLGILAYATLAIGLLKGLYRPVGYGLILLPILLKSRDTLDFLRAIRQLVARCRAFKGRAAGLLLAFLGLAALLNLVGALGPATNTDALAYQFALPRFWVRQHTLSYVPSLFPSSWPATINMLYTLADLVSGLRTAQLLNWGMGLLALATLYRLGRLWLEPVPALLSCAAFYAISDVSYQSAQAGIELGATSFLLLALLALARWTDSGGRAWFWFLAVFAGLYMASKLNHVIGPLTLAAAVFLLAWPRAERRLVGAVGRTLTFGLIALAVASPWYIRSWALTGNPVFPFFTGFFGSLDGLVLQETIPAFGWEKTGTPMAFLSFPWDYTMGTHNFGAGQIGPLYLSFLPFVFARRPRSVLSLAMTLFVLLFTVAWFFTYRPIRVLFPVMALASIPMALGAMLLADWNRKGKGLVILAVSFWLATGLAANLRFHAPAIPVVLGFLSEAQFLENHFSASRQGYTEYRVWTYLNQHLPPDAKVLIWDRRGLYLERNYLWAWAMPRGLVSPESLKDPELMRSELHRLGVTHVVFHEPSPDARVAALVKVIKATGYLRSYYQTGSTEVYEVDCNPGNSSKG